MRAPVQDPTFREAMLTAAQAAGIPAAGAQLMRVGSNVLWSLPGEVVARVHRGGTVEAAQREADMAAYLRAHAVACAVPLGSAVLGAGTPVTFWRALHGQGAATYGQLAGALRQVHAVPAPAGLRPLDPLGALEPRLEGLPLASAYDRAWLGEQFLEGHERLAGLGRVPHMPLALLHGDPWPGNTLVVDGQVVLLDLEAVAWGYREWDLVNTAVSRACFSDVSQQDYEQFCAVYGCDVTQWAGYRVLAACRELELLFHAMEYALARPGFLVHAQHRLECLMGLHGPRPWMWKATAG